MKLQYRKAMSDDAEKAYYIVQHTKDVIYPDYYTREVVEYVDRYYTFEIIKSDIEQGRTRVPSPKKQTKNAGEKPNEKNDKYGIKLLYCTAFIPRFT